MSAWSGLYFSDSLYLWPSAASVTIASGQRLTASMSTAVLLTDGTTFHYSICYRPQGSTVVTSLDNSESLTTTTGSHVTVSYDVATASGALPAGTYSVGLCARTVGAGIYATRVHGWVMVHN